MSWSIASLAGGTAALLAAVLTGQAPRSAVAVERSIAALVTAAEAKGSRVGVFAKELDGGRVLAAHRQEELFAPASNQKLVVAAAVLSELGAGHRFTTDFALRDGVLIVGAGGDPNWRSDGEHDPRTLLAGVARRLAAARVEAVRSIEVDARGFVGPDRPASWPRDQLHLDYCAPSSGLLLDGATWSVELRGAADGAPAGARLVAPWTGYRIEGVLRCTNDRKQGGRYKIAERDGVLALEGNFWSRSEARVARGACADPTGVFLRGLRSALDDAGILVHPDAPRTSLELPGISTPLAPALVRALRDSSNVDAEQLLRALGAARGDASFAGSLAALRDALARSCPDGLPEGLVLADGSGLSRADRCTPAVLVEVLCATAAHADAELVLAALPRAGIDGTLEKRFLGSGLEGRVRAKTGTIAGASTLSGFLARQDGRIVAFSILCDTSGNRRDAIDPRRLQEQIVAALDGARG
ncbi:MAG: D-alanyl-D-alanine carboxypeptidase/D-alanyl-D-alanine-endopeptidase [Planctomycetes bacterium]|nr:D-alanyl-D-alanine carboxypeptidase/D-alanyl-D-alanine-endopeptidase [Planctomycetota bacterium]